MSDPICSLCGDVMVNLSTNVDDDQRNTELVQGVYYHFEQVHPEKAEWEIQDEIEKHSWDVSSSFVDRSLDRYSGSIDFESYTKEFGGGTGKFDWESEYFSIISVHWESIEGLEKLAEFGNRIERLQDEIQSDKMRMGAGPYQRLPELDEISEEDLRFLKEAVEKLDDIEEKLWDKYHRINNESYANEEQQDPEDTCERCGKNKTTHQYLDHDFSQGEYEPFTESKASELGIDDWDKTGTDGVGLGKLQSFGIPAGITCPRCGSDDLTRDFSGIYYSSPEDAVACKNCNKIFSITTGQDSMSESISIEDYEAPDYLIVDDEEDTGIIDAEDVGSEDPFNVKGLTDNPKFDFESFQKKHSMCKGCMENALEKLTRESQMSDTMFQQGDFETYDEWENFALINGLSQQEAIDTWEKLNPSYGFESKASEFMQVMCINCSRSFDLYEDGGKCTYCGHNNAEFYLRGHSKPEEPEYKKSGPAPRIQESLLDEGLSPEVVDYYQKHSGKNNPTTDEMDRIDSDAEAGIIDAYFEGDDGNIYFGKTYEDAVPKYARETNIGCPYCKATGYDDTLDGKHKCEHCNGTGKVDKGKAMMYYFGGDSYSTEAYYVETDVGYYENIEDLDEAEQIAKDEGGKVFQYPQEEDEEGYSDDMKDYQAQKEQEEEDEEEQLTESQLLQKGNESYKVLENNSNIRFE